MDKLHKECEKVAEATWNACMKIREKPRTDLGCIHMKDFAKLACISDFKVDYPK